MYNNYSQLSDQNDLYSSRSDSFSQVRSCVSTKSAPKINEIVRFQLLNYSDIQDFDIELLPVSSDHNQLSEQLSSYMNYHTTQIPIGQNHQAQIPAIITSSIYLKKKGENIQSIKYRKIHSPAKDNKFFLENRDLIQQVLGQKTYEQINLIRTTMEKKSSFQNIKQYLGNEEIISFWEQYFIDKEKQLLRLRRKKRRVK